MSERFQTFDWFPFARDYNPFQKKFKEVYWDQYEIGHADEILGTMGISTCLAITLYDIERRLGTLSHITGWLEAPEEMQPENVIDTLLRQLSRDCRKLEATLSGEGEEGTDRDRKSKIVRAKLNSYGIPIIGEDLCLSERGRLVFLDCSEGKVDVYRA